MLLPTISPIYPPTVRKVRVGFMLSFRVLFSYTSLRCDQLVCRVCTRTCEGGPSSYGSDSLQSIKPLNKPPAAPRKIRPMKRARKFNSPENISTQAARRRPRVDDENSDHQQREPGLSTISGCKRTICRKCTVEDSMRYALQARFIFYPEPPIYCP